jgi:hypothetical protein
MAFLLGTFNSTHGIYEFKGRHFIAKWYANSIRNTNINEIYNIVCAGYDSKPNPQWQKSVLVTYRQRWEEIKKHYEGIYAMAQLHYYDESSNIGGTPFWAMPFQQSGGALIHEYAPGKVAWLRDENKFDNDVYLFFLDSPPTPDQETGSGSPGTDKPDIFYSEKYRITGKWGNQDINLLIAPEPEELDNG